MQLIVDIPNITLLSKIESLLKKFQNNGVKIQIEKENHKYKSFDYSNEDIEKNWKDILMQSESDADYYKSELYYEERGSYLMEKYK